MMHTVFVALILKLEKHSINNCYCICRYWTSL